MSEKVEHSSLDAKVSCCWDLAGKPRGVLMGKLFTGRCTAQQPSVELPGGLLREASGHWHLWPVQEPDCRNPRPFSEVNQESFSF